MALFQIVFYNDTETLIDGVTHRNSIHQEIVNFKGNKADLFRLVLSYPYNDFIDSKTIEIFDFRNKCDRFAFLRKKEDGTLCFAHHSDSWFGDEFRENYPEWHKKHKPV